MTRSLRQTVSSCSCHSNRTTTNSGIKQTTKGKAPLIKGQKTASSYRVPCLFAGRYTAMVDCGPSLGISKPQLRELGSIHRPGDKQGGQLRQKIKKQVFKRRVSRQKQVRSLMADGANGRVAGRKHPRATEYIQRPLGRFYSEASWSRASKVGLNVDLFLQERFLTLPPFGLGHTFEQDLATDSSRFLYQALSQFPIMLAERLE